MLWTNIRPAHTRLTRPAVNTIETDGAFLLELALPGWTKDQVTLEVDGDLLHVRGERKAAEGDDAPAYRRRQFGLDAFEKSFHMPETIDVEAIGAALELGVLTITLPKVPEAQPVRKAIEVA